MATPPVLLRVTMHVLILSERVAAGDLQAVAEVEALAALLESERLWKSCLNGA